MQFAGKKPWTVEELRDVLVKTLGYIMQEIGGKIAMKQPGETEKDIINYKVGIKLQHLAQLHGIYFSTHEWVELIKKEQNNDIKTLMTHLCKLYVITQLQRLAEPVIEGGFICPVKWSLLHVEKEVAMKEIRPHVAVLLDSFGIPDKLLRSEVVRGNPYESFLNRARESEINTSVTKSALEVGKIHEVLGSKMFSEKLKGQRQA